MILNEWNGDQMEHNGWTLNGRFTNGKKCWTCTAGITHVCNIFCGSRNQNFCNVLTQKELKMDPKIIELSENPYQIPCPILSFHTFGSLAPPKPICLCIFPLLSLVASKSQSMHVLASRSERVRRSHGRSTLFPRSFHDSTVRKPNHWWYLMIFVGIIYHVVLYVLSDYRCCQQVKRKVLLKSENCRRIHAFQQASKLKEILYILDLSQASLVCKVPNTMPRLTDSGVTVITPGGSASHLVKLIDRGCFNDSPGKQNPPKVRLSLSLVWRMCIKRYWPLSFYQTCICIWHHIHGIHGHCGQYSLSTWCLPSHAAHPQHEELQGRSARHIQPAQLAVNSHRWKRPRLASTRSPSRKEDEQARETCSTQRTTRQGRRFIEILVANRKKSILNCCMDLISAVTAWSEWFEIQKIWCLA